MNPIIDPVTGAVTVKLSVKGNRKMMVTAGKLTAAETVTFQLDEEGVSPLGDLYQDGVIRQLTATHNATVINGPIDLEVTKSVTAAAVGVFIKGL